MSDISFRKLLVAINAGVPLILLGYDGLIAHSLGADPVKFAILTTGKLSLIFITLTLFVTPIRKIFGWNSIIFYRRTLGLYAFFYALAHLLIFYALDQSGNLSSTFSEIVKRQYLWFGTAALVLMTPLAVTSANRMIQLLGAKRWQLLHRLTYFAAIAAVVHYYMKQKSYKGQPIIYGLIIGALLLFRIVSYFVKRKTSTHAASTTRPRYWRGSLKVIEIIQETPDVKTFRLAGENGPLPFDYQAGQYLNISLKIGDKKVNRSYTIASGSTHKNYCELSIKREANGTASRYMHDQVRVGDALDIGAPAGKFVFDPKEARSIVLIAGGVGITPVMSILRSLAHRNWDGKVNFIFSTKTQNDIIFKKELLDLQRRYSNLNLAITLSRETGSDWNGHTGRITPEMLKKVVPSIANELIYLCGPSEMMEPVRKMLIDLGASESNIRSEAFESAVATASSNLEYQNSANIFSDDRPKTITFVRSNKICTIQNGTTILEASEECGVNINFECRSGICGQCKTRLRSGDVAMETQDALSAEDLKNQTILACQAVPLGDVQVDA